MDRGTFAGMPAPTGRRAGGLRGRHLWCSAALGLAVAGVAAAQETTFPRPGHNLYGVTGLIDTPSGQMQPDGQISVTTSYFGGVSRNTLSAQVFPGVEAAFRYNLIDDWFAPGTAGGTTLYDSSFDLRGRIVTEGPWRPSVVIGFQDFLGNGVNAGEYVAATKSLPLGSFGAVSVTGGIGWGRFAQRSGFDNPVCELFEDACVRDDVPPDARTFNVSNYLSGENLGVFGGLEWHTPINGLSVKMEYTEDAYDRETRFGDFDQEIAVNMGLEYRPRDWVELGAYWMYGDAFGLRVTLNGNVSDPLSRRDDAPAPLPLVSRPVPEGALARETLGTVTPGLPVGPATQFVAGTVRDVTVETRLGNLRWAMATLGPGAAATCPTDAAKALDAELGVLDAVTFSTPDGAPVCTVALRPEGERAIRAVQRSAIEHPTDWHADAQARTAILADLADALRAEGLTLVSATLEPTVVQIRIENPRYRETPRAIGRAARALTRTMPPSVALFEVVPVEKGLATVHVALDRTVLEDQANRPDATRATWLSARVTDAPPQAATAVPGDAAWPRLTWSLTPAAPISVFDPEDRIRADVQVKAGATLALTPGFGISAEVRKRVVGDLDEVKPNTTGDLPRVRSDLGRYLDEGDPGITRLNAHAATKLAPDIYATASAGLLETMFAGISGEVLWKPADQSWGLGAEVAYARQRGFDTLFDLRDYDTVTGHVSLYWDTGFHGIAAQVDGGRYLAGDWGGTVGLKRRFDNGWEIGGFATLTDASDGELDRGSFDKGLYLTIPFNWGLPYESRSSVEAVVRPLTRDDGQRLDLDNRLHPIVQDQHRNGLRRSWGGFWE